MRARTLVGWVDRHGAITSGSWGGGSEWGRDWAVLQTSKGKLVAYRFDDPKEPDVPKTGVIQVCDSWRELEAVVPAKIFEEALREAGIKKPSEYREAPLEI